MMNQKAFSNNRSTLIESEKSDFSSKKFLQRISFLDFFDNEKTIHRFYFSQIKIDV